MAISGKAARNLISKLTFGLRFVKKMVNCDDPDTYHRMRRRDVAGWVWRSRCGVTVISNQ
jgi:hypothetical protein